MNKPESEGTFADVARCKWEQAKDALEQIGVAKEVVELVKDYLVQKGLF